MQVAKVVVLEDPASLNNTEQPDVKIKTWRSRAMASKAVACRQVGKEMSIFYFLFILGKSGPTRGT